MPHPRAAGAREIAGDHGRLREIISPHQPDCGRSHLASSCMIPRQSRTANAANAHEGMLDCARLREIERDCGRLYLAQITSASVHLGPFPLLREVPRSFKKSHAWIPASKSVVFSDSTLQTPSKTIWIMCVAPIVRVFNTFRPFPAPTYI